jgi:hypothetical protein
MSSVTDTLINGSAQVQVETRTEAGFLLAPEIAAAAKMMGVDPVDLCVRMIRNGDLAGAETTFGPAMFSAACKAITLEDAAIKAKGKGAKLDPTRDLWGSILEAGYGAMIEAYNVIKASETQCPTTADHAWPSDLLGFLGTVTHSPDAKPGLAGQPKGSFATGVAKLGDRNVDLCLRINARQGSRSK